MKNRNAYDQRSKEILSEASVISNILYYCIPEYKGLSKKEILTYIDGYDGSKYIKCLPNEDNRIDEARINYDILFTSKIPGSNDKIGLYINIEAQNLSTPGYSLLKRAIYYSARLVSRQKGETFNKSDFDNLKKVYSIWICTEPKDKELDTINYYTLHEENIKGNYHTDEDYKLINIIFLNIGNDYNYYDSKDDILKMLSLLFKQTSLNIKETSNLLNKEYNIHKKEEEVSKMCSLAEGIAYKAELKGIEKGMLKGIEKGKLEGQVEGQLSTLLNLINNHIISKEDAFKSINDNKLKEELIKRLKN